MLARNLSCSEAHVHDRHRTAKMRDSRLRFSGVGCDVRRLTPTCHAGGRGFEPGRPRQSPVSLPRTHVERLAGVDLEATQRLVEGRRCRSQRNRRRGARCWVGVVLNEMSMAQTVVTRLGQRRRTNCEGADRGAKSRRRVAARDVHGCRGVGTTSALCRCGDPHASFSGIVAARANCASRRPSRPRRRSSDASRHDARRSDRGAGARTRLG